MAYNFQLSGYLGKGGTYKLLSQYYFQPKIMDLVEHFIGTYHSYKYTKLIFTQAPQTLLLQILLFVLFIVRCGSLIGLYRLLAIIRKILLVPIWRQKLRECIGKILCLKLTPGKGKPISYYLLEQLSVQRFTYLYFTNISARCSVIKVLVLSTLLYIYFLAPFLSFIYYLIYSSIQLIYSKRLQGGILYFF